MHTIFGADGEYINSQLSYAALKGEPIYVSDKYESTTAQTTIRVKASSKVVSSSASLRKSIAQQYTTVNDETQSLNQLSAQEKTLAAQQFDIIQSSNPMLDDYHTGIRSAEEISFSTLQNYTPLKLTDVTGYLSSDLLIHLLRYDII